MGKGMEGVVIRGWRQLTGISPSAAGSACHLHFTASTEGFRLPKPYTLLAEATLLSRDRSTHAVLKPRFVGIVSRRILCRFFC